MKQIILVILLLLTVCTGCGQRTTGVEVDGYMQITAEEAKKMMEQDPDAMILDVRELSEYQQGHIPGATLLPVGQIRADAAALIPDQETTVLVYCRSGNRSKTAAAALAELGYTNIYEFGGIQDWPYETTKD